MSKATSSNTAFTARLRAAVPVARQLLINDGIDPASPTLEDSIQAPAPDQLTEAQMNQLIDWTAAAYTLGVAVGLLLGPAFLEAVQDGGR
jgi:hypothetical protein